MTTQKIIKITLAVLITDFLVAKIIKPKVLIKEKLPFNYNGLTIPPVGIFIQKEDANNEILLKHEKIHWQQYKKTGLIIYYLKYFAQKTILGYDKMPMEIEARKLSGENAECIINYTECVRNGKAKTVQQQNFRIKT